MSWNLWWTYSRKLLSCETKGFSQSFGATLSCMMSVRQTLTSWKSQEHLKAYPHDTIVVHDSSLWRMWLCHKSTIPVCYSFANVAAGPKDSYDWIGYIKMNNRIRQSHRVNGPLHAYIRFCVKFIGKMYPECVVRIGVTVTNTYVGCYCVSISFEDV